MYDRLSQKLQEIDEQIQQLQKLRDELLPLVERCGEKLTHPDSHHECVVLED